MFWFTLIGGQFANRFEFFFKSRRDALVAVKFGRDMLGAPTPMIDHDVRSGALAASNIT
ncbi:MAG: hypothetical protein JKY47_02380 [Thalassospira sp.]|nr:hypothetical protein [Thalassospira sp.]